MLKALLDANVASVRRRVAQGDCPVEPALSVEILEHMVQDLADAAYTPRPVEGEVEQACQRIQRWMDDEHRDLAPGQIGAELSYDDVTTVLRAALARPVEAGAGKLAEVERLRADIQRLHDEHGSSFCDECGAPLFDGDETDTDEDETVALCAGHIRPGEPIYSYRNAALARPVEAGAGKLAEMEPFGYWIEQKGAEPALLRKPAYIPEPSDLRTVTPLFTRPGETPRSVEVESIVVLRSALEKSRSGWQNALEFGLLPRQHRDTAKALVDEATAALTTPAGRIAEGGASIPAEVTLDNHMRITIEPGSGDVTLWNEAGDPIGCGTANVSTSIPTGRIAEGGR